MNISKLRASVVDAQRQGAPDNAMISIPIGELDQVLEEVEALEGQRNALDVRLPQGDEKQLRDALRELEAHRDELAANLRSVEAIAEAAKRDLREAELMRDYWHKAADTNQEMARQLAIDLEAAEKSADLWQRQCQQAREQREAHRATWDHNDDGEISDNAELAELAEYTDQTGQKCSAWDPDAVGFRIRTSDDLETLEVRPTYTDQANGLIERANQSDHWSDLRQRVLELEQRLGNVEGHLGMSYSEGDLAELFGATDEEEQDQ